MVFHAFFGVILLQSTTVTAPDWFAAVYPPWASSLLADQHLGAAIAWAFGEIPAAIVFAIMVRRWIRADEREQARLDCTVTPNTFDDRRNPAGAGNPVRAAQAACSYS